MIFGKLADLSSGIIITVKLNFNWLAPLGECQFAEREVADSNPGRTNTQGL